MAASPADEPCDPGNGHGERDRRRSWLSPSEPLDATTLHHVPTSTWSDRQLGVQLSGLGIRERPVSGGSRELAEVRIGDLEQATGTSSMTSASLGHAPSNEWQYTRETAGHLSRRGVQKPDRAEV